ncbi:MAG: hypothetical protein H6742_04270 [Alphaproteobacteria bacterium]|nr:hypothetical protein [Alphaproteobacteria bacterium]
MAARDVVGRLVRGALTENLPFKGLSLVFALAIWAWVQSSEVVEVRTRARVNWALPDTDELVVARQVPKTVVTTVSGPQGVVRRLVRGDLELDVDLRDAEEGAVSVDFTELEVRGLPAGVDVVQLSPPAIDVAFDRPLTREVQVRPSVIGEVADGWRLVAVTVQPETVEITGPQSLVREVSEIPTDIIELGSARGDISAEVQLLPPEKVIEIAPGSPASVRIEVDVEAIVAERTFDEVPVMVRGSTDWIPDPRVARVVLRGPQTRVGQISLDRVSVVIQAPEGAPAAGGTTRSWQPELDDDLVDVLHDGDPDEIEVLRVAPKSFRLYPRQ